MSRKFFIQFLIIITIFSFQSLNAEYLFLNNGKIIEGRIVQQTNQFYHIKSKNSGMHKYKRSHVLRVLYGKKRFGKMIIRLNTGEEKTAFKIAETQNKYIFRTKLHKPEEFSLEKNKILFMTETNPSELLGISSLTSISLSWKPPYNAVKEYTIYIKTKDTSTFKKTATTANKYYTISNLKPAQEYSILVRAVDSDNDESIPSNTITLKTEKTPATPEKLSINIIHDKKNKKNIKAQLAWKNNANKKAKPEKYYIYKRVPTGHTKIGETEHTHFTVKNLSSEKTAYFTIRAVNSSGNLSYKSSEVHTRELAFSVNIYSSLLVPLADFHDIFFLGAGALADCNLENLFFRNFIISISSGYWHLFSNQNSINYAHVIPLMGAVSYRFIPAKNFTLTAKISAGTAYSIINYNDTGISGSETTADAFEPIAMAAISGGYTLNDTITLEASLMYGFIIESTGLMHFTGCTAGALFRF